ncbi:pyrBI operon leader peptide [Salmonella enterica subsp. enterica serovar Weltevreden]|nr:pyrBI operon leader peptide [Salmonella enterica subsp. enterica serovar Weltevreden]
MCREEAWFSVVRHSVFTASEKKDAGLPFFFPLKEPNREAPSIEGLFTGRQEING